jgi:hypothetical protein
VVSCNALLGRRRCTTHTQYSRLFIHIDFALLHVQGQPQWSAAMRCWAGGAACTGHLQQLLCLQAPLHAGGLLGNWQLMEALKEGFCFAAGDYREQLRAAADQPHTAGVLAGGMFSCCLWVCIGQGVITLRCS